MCVCVFTVRLIVALLAMDAAVGCFCYSYSECIIIADVSVVRTCSFVGFSPINLAFVAAAVASGH